MSLDGISGQVLSYDIIGSSFIIPIITLRKMKEKVTMKNVQKINCLNIVK